MTQTTVRGFTFSVDPADFAAVAGWVARRIPAKPKNPILGGVKLGITDGSTQTISAFDFEVSTRATMEVIGDGDGVALVSGRLLAALVDTFPAKSALTVKWSGGMVEMSCGGWEGNLPTMPIEDYPELPAIPATIGTVDAKALGTLVEQVSSAAGKDETHPVLTGIHTTFTATEIVMVGSDNYRITSGRIPWQPSAEYTEGQSALIPVSALTDAAKVLSQSDDTVTISLAPDSNGMLALVGETISVTTRLLGDEYPPSPAATLRKFAAGPSPATVSIDALTRALRRAELVREKAPVFLVMDTNTITVEVTETEEHKASSDRLSCQYDGPQISAAINPQYLADALSSLNTDMAVISIDHPTKAPVIITPPINPTHYRHLISPIRRARLPQS